MRQAEPLVLRVEGDGAFEMRQRLGVFAALGVRDRQHVQGVVVVRVFVADQPQV